ncbi:MAG: tRNA (adenosine(37)-N6)-dimethylallyltransferase MiaA, partial [Clostridia bacterium]|nr:tRNA (adenosine(37)-N6)-dimethylallyltransferase MiaA [Clostridia bacterium]
TAKPTPEEQAGIPHHMIDVAEPDQPFSCADYVKAAREAVEEITARGRLPIFCGGTGLYLDSLLRGGNFGETDTDPALRQELLEFAQNYGNHALHERLTAIDPESAAAIHENNVKRVIRAIEIYQTTGMTKTEADRRSRIPDSPYDATVVGLRYPEREILYDRINQRVDMMLDQGLLEETRQLLAEGVFARNSTAAQAIGYKELLGYLRGEESLADAVERLKLATRRYAKRQITWFGAKDYVRWVDMTREGKIRAEDELLQEILTLLNQ